MDEDLEGGFEELQEEDTDLFDEESLEELKEDDEISSEEEGFMNGYRDALKRAKRTEEEELEE